MPVQIRDIFTEKIGDPLIFAPSVCTSWGSILAIIGHWEEPQDAAFPVPQLFCLQPASANSLLTMYES